MKGLIMLIRFFAFYWSLMLFMTKLEGHIAFGLFICPLICYAFLMRNVS